MLILALVLILLFGGLGFLSHVLWWGLVLAAVVLVANAVTGSRAPRV
jgi:hypothetical protein